MKIDKIAGISVADLAKEYGTPLYVYEIDKVDQRFEMLKDFGIIRYALKACSNISFLNHLRRLGAYVDCVSAGELRRAERAGFKVGNGSHEVVFTCDIFDHETLKLVTEKQIPVNVGSVDMIEQLGPVAKLKEITVRINPGFGHGHSQKTNTGGESSKHGIWHGDLELVKKSAAKWGIKITGLHMHIGSGTDLKHLSEVCEKFMETAREIGPDLQMISAGGGLPIPYRNTDQEIDLDGYKQLWWDVKARLEKDFNHPLRLETEPGRYLSAEAGNLIAEVRAVKNQGTQRFALLDTGFTELARPIMYGSYHPIAVFNNATTNEDVVIAGPLCESGDVFTQKDGGFVETRNLPKLEVGDFVVLKNAGSYGAVMASNYNSRVLAPEVFVKEGKSVLVRKRQTIDSLIDLETLVDL